MRKKLHIFLIIIGIIAAILVVNAILFFTAKPKVSVNYVAEYNRITLPQNYDPNENAAPYYQKAFDAFVEMPIELQKLTYRGWLTDFNDTEQALLEKWLASNSQAFEYFKVAADKPYYWLKRQAGKDNSMLSMTLPELTSLYRLTKALMWHAKQNASKGRSKAAFEDIIYCYKAGQQKCRTPSWELEQRTGLEIKQNALYNAMVILNRVQVDNTTLKQFQNALQEEFDNDTYVLDITTERLFLCDTLQRIFVDSGKGTGRLYWKEAKVFWPDDSSSYSLWDVLRHNLGIMPALY